MRKPLVIIVTLFVLLSACSDDDATPTTSFGPGSGISAVAAAFDPDSIHFVASLQRFDACSDVLAYFQAEAMARVSAYGLQGGGGFYPVPFAAEESLTVTADSAGGFDESAPATTGAPVAREGVDYSGSNVQVVGVDEPDIMKTDGSRILAITNQSLSYVDLTSGTGEVVGSLSLPGYDHRFFMNGDTAVVFARGDGYAIPFADESRIPSYQGPQTLVFEVDLSDPGHLTVSRTMRIDGNFLSARSVGGMVRIVVSAYPSDLPFVYPSGQAAEQIALETNRRVIAESTIDDWLPNYTLVGGTDGDIIGQGLLVDCSQVHRPAEFAGFDTLAVLTVDMDTGLRAPSGAAVIAQGETVYASQESLYVATNVWVPNELWGTDVTRGIEEDYSSAIHKFDISGTTTEYRASGSVSGHLLNQFAMDEYEGNLRVATTQGPPWGFDDSSESFVTVLREDNGKLQELGRVGDMGRGERIFSVRFIEDAAYVVTFRQVDPFYVIDLSDPNSPRVAGELKIAGYSGYLHPMGNGRILGVGQAATQDGFTTGAKATVFDVSDPENPRDVGSWAMGGSSSAVEWDHLAFLYWPPDDLAVLPVQSWEERFSGAVVLNTASGVSEVGRIAHGAVGSIGISSDCSRLSTDEILALDPNAEIDDTISAFVCGEGEDVVEGSFTCESVSYDQAVTLAEESGVDLTSVLGEGDRLVVCFPEFSDYGGQAPQIIRSLVVGDQIWTLSWQSLQSNSIADLSIGQTLPLG